MPRTEPDLPFLADGDFTVVDLGGGPLSWTLWADTRDVPLGEAQAGDRHLNVHDARGYLRSWPG